MKTRTIVSGLGAVAIGVSVLFTALKTTSVLREEDSDELPQEIYSVSAPANTDHKDSVKAGQKMMDRCFIFKNDDGSIDEIVKLDDIVGKKTPFLDGGYVFKVPSEDRKLLERLVFAEAGTTETFKGQVAIAAEVLNRVQSPDFPDTIPEVLAQEGQYYPDGIPYWTDTEGVWRPVYDSDITVKTEAAVELALEGADPTEKILGGTGALYHYEPIISRGDGKEYILHQIKIGAHKFYRSQMGLPGYENQLEMVP
ncbi:MAG: cell wall hydrolase [Clostridia bacterium]|nr:cell wall hydrolase [Clostridia bacterium]